MNAIGAECDVRQIGHPGPETGVSAVPGAIGRTRAADPAKATPSGACGPDSGLAGRVVRARDVGGHGA
jgi:hypothetical protein